VAECVEDEATVDVLREIGVNWVQGNFFGAPAMEAGARAPGNLHARRRPA